MADPKPVTPDIPPSAQEPENVGNAFMKSDGVLEMMLRTVARSGAIGETMMVVEPNDSRYKAMVAHLGGIKPGEARAIPPFPAE
jgi:hypothetical protein